MILTKKYLAESGADELTILREENNALGEIVDDLPVDAHDMGVHFWCDPKDYCVNGDDTEEPE